MEDCEENGNKPGSSSGGEGTVSVREVRRDQPKKMFKTTRKATAHMECTHRVQKGISQYDMLNHGLS